MVKPIHKQVSGNSAAKMGKSIAKIISIQYYIAHIFLYLPLCNLDMISRF